MPNNGRPSPNHGWTNQWNENSNPLVYDKTNLDGKDHYVWFEAKGYGQYVGVTISILQNQDKLWGEGDMFFIDDPTKPVSPGGTGSEDYFVGAWDFGAPFSCQLYAAHVVDKELARRFQRLPVPFGLSRSLYKVHEGDHRTRPCQPPVPITTTPSLTGIRQSRTYRFPLFPRWTTEFRRSNSSADLETRGGENPPGSRRNRR
jgi:Protein of unknown function (DUF2961)